MYKNVRWLHFNATSHSFPLSVQTADVAFLLHFGLVFFHTLQFLVHALQVGFHRQTMVVSEAVSVGYIRTGKRSGIERVGFPVIPRRTDVFRSASRTSGVSDVSGHQTLPPPYPWPPLSHHRWRGRFRNAGYGLAPPVPCTSA